MTAGLEKHSNESCDPEMLGPSGPTRDRKLKIYKVMSWIGLLLLSLTILPKTLPSSSITSITSTTATNNNDSHEFNANEYYPNMAPKRGIDISPLIRKPSLDPDPKHLHKSLHGAVASDIKECSDLGVDVLKKGGNAADTAVTVALCVGSINSFNSGIGGGGYIVSRKYKEKTIAIDAREAAPLASHKDMYQGQEQLSKVGGLAAGIPGEIKGLYTLFESQGSGKVTWREVITPVVDLLRTGFNVSIVLGASVEADKDFFRQHPDDWSYVFKPGSKYEIIKPGDWITRPNLANTLELIANNGSDAIFYDPDGPIASSLIDVVNKHGGIFTREDFETYEVDVYDALHTTYLGNDVYTCAGSCSGPALISGLKILDKFGKARAGDMLPIPTHRLIETMKWVASGRSRLGDPLTKESEFIQSDEWTEYAYNKINDGKTLPNWTDYEPKYEITEPHGTTHFSIVDSEHNAVSMTSTINLLFGCLVRDPKTGVVLNNEMDDFSIPGTSNAFGVAPSVYNFIRPKKRPLSSTVPTIVVNELGKPDLVIGAAGGSRITTSVLQAIVRTYSYDMPLLETIAYPRLHHQLIPNRVEHEERAGSDIGEALELRGHEVLEVVPKSVINAIRRWEGEWHAVSDYWRKRGEASVI